MSENSYEPVIDVANRIIDNIAEETAYLSPANRLMVLGYVAELCKAHEQTVLLHEYHTLLYPAASTNHYSEGEDE